MPQPATINTTCIRLSKKGVDPSLPNLWGQTALHKALENGHLKVARLLLGQKKVTIEFKDSKGRTALHLAVARAVRAHGAETHEKSKERVTLSAADADEMVRFLLWKGTKFDEKDKEGKSAVDLAKEERR